MADVEPQNRSAVYHEYAALLRRLHEVMSRGGGDSPEADAIRDEMDGPWYALCEEERELVGGLSADLYTLTSDSPIEHPTEFGVFDAELAHGIRVARDSQDHQRLLETLRENPERVSADRAAFLRSLSYEQLGDVESAVLFLERAVNLSKDEDSYAVALLMKLVEHGYVQRALEWATVFQHLCKNRDTSNQLRLTVGHVYLNAAMHETSAKSEISLRRASNIFEQVASFEDIDGADEHGRLLVTHAFLSLAVTRRLRNEHEKANAPLDMASAIDPQGKLVLAIRDLLIVKAGSQATRDNLRRAVEALSQSLISMVEQRLNSEELSYPY